MNSLIAKAMDTSNKNTLVLNASNKNATVTIPSDMSAIIMNPSNKNTPLANTIPERDTHITTDEMVERQQEKKKNLLQGERTELLDVIMPASARETQRLGCRPSRQALGLAARRARQADRLARDEANRRTRQADRLVRHEALGLDELTLED